jgi:hypothetical protein
VIKDAALLSGQIVEKIWDYLIFELGRVGSSGMDGGATQWYSPCLIIYQLACSEESRVCAVPVCVTGTERPLVVLSHSVAVLILTYCQSKDSVPDFWRKCGKQRGLLLSMAVAGIYSY